MTYTVNKDAMNIHSLDLCENVFSSLINTWEDNS